MGYVHPGVSQSAAKRFYKVLVELNLVSWPVLSIDVGEIDYTPSK
jgi:hypothetical protein